MILQDFSKQIILLIISLTITPSIIFLGNNYLLTEFFTIKFFYFIFCYNLIFVAIAFIVNYFFNKKILLIVLFFAYLTFIQFYFVDLQNVLKIYKNGHTAYYVLFFILFLCLILTFYSNSSIFRNFIFLFLSLNILISVYNLVPTINKSLQSFFKSTNTKNSSSILKNFHSAKYPNIFYIIPDGLASPKILKEYANIDFNDSVQKFLKKDFHVQKHNYSSYNTTYLSLAALFKMDYPATENTQKYKNRSNFYPSIRDKNPSPAIVQYLKKNNYKFVIAPPKWGGCPSSIDYICLTPTSNSYYESIFYDYAISVFLEKSLLNKIEITYNSFFINKDINDTIITTIDKMKKNPQIWSNGGVFTMIHMMIPHQPYREHNCTITDRFSNPSKEGYKSSAYCAFNRIHKISDFIIKNFPNATIVVQSDHGVDTNLYEGKKFNEISHSLIDQRMGSFTAVRGCNAKQAAKLNQVHIIKSIVDCVSGNTQTKQLENKSYFGLYEQSPDFGKVFQVFTHN